MNRELYEIIFVVLLTASIGVSCFLIGPKIIDDPAISLAEAEKYYQIAEEAKLNEQEVHREQYVATINGLAYFHEAKAKRDALTRDTLNILIKLVGLVFIIQCFSLFGRYVQSKKV